MAYISSYKDQNWLIPQSIRDMISEDHICFFIEEFVDSLDFSGFDLIYEGPGHPAYPPRILMKVILQGMLCKERSSRRLANTCRENFVFMYLAEKVQPNFRTICRFRRDNAKFIKEAFKETVSLASDNNLVDLSLICIDGSKMKANASKKKCLKREQVEQLDSIIDKMIEEDIRQDKIDEEIYKSEENLTNLDRKSLKEIVRTYKKSKDKEKIKEKCKKVEKEFQGDEKVKQVSLTDPECRMMQNKKGTYELGYNVQFTADFKDQIILANDVCQDRNDLNQLQPQIESTKENIKLKKDTKVGADCGYSSGKNLKFLEDEKLEGYIPNKTQAKELDDREQALKQDDYEYDWERDEVIVDRIRLRYCNTYYNKKDNANYHCYKSDNNKISKFVPEFFRERLRMKEKMDTESGKKIYNLRKTVVEPVIGNIKENLGFREFRLRGLDGVRLELNLVSIVHNLKKIWLAGGKISKDNKIFIFVLVKNIECGTACTTNLKILGLEYRRHFKRMPNLLII